LRGGEWICSLPSLRFTDPPPLATLRCFPNSYQSWRVSPDILLTDDRPHSVILFTGNDPDLPQILYAFFSFARGVGKLSAVPYSHLSRLSSPTFRKHCERSHIHGPPHYQQCVIWNSESGIRCTGIRRPDNLYGRSSSGQRCRCRLQRAKKRLSTTHKD
jgi:hypothetical protein